MENGNSANTANNNAKGVSNTANNNANTANNNTQGVSNTDDGVSNNNAGQYGVSQNTPPNNPSNDGAPPDETGTNTKLVKMVANICLNIFIWLYRAFTFFFFKLIPISLGILIIILLVKLLTHRRFRFLQLYRTVDFDGFSKKYASEFMRSLSVINDNINKPPGGTQSNANAVISGNQGTITELSQNISTFLNGRSDDAPDLIDDFMTYLKFGKSIKQRKDDIYRENLFANSGDRFKGSNGLLNESAMATFEENVIGSIDGILSLCKQISDNVDKQSSSPMDDDTMVLITHFHLMRMYKGYMPAVEELSSARTKMAVLIDYYWPMVKDTITKRIPPLWTEFPVRFMKGINLGIDTWTSLGKKIANMPCSLAYSDAAERDERCGANESFEDEKKSKDNDKDKNYDDDDGGGEVTEGFIGMLKAVADFFIGIKDVALAIAKLFVDFPKDPVGSIIRLLTILIGLAIGLILICIYTILTVVGFGYILGFSLGWFWAFTVALFGTVLYILLIIVYAIPYLILWLIDLVTGGLIVKLMRCEQLPDEWIERSNYVYGNGFERSLIYLGMVMRPCARRFRPELGGCMCKRQKHEIPDFCPQQQLFKLFMGRSIQRIGAGPVVYDKYRPLPNFRYALPRAKARALSKAFADKEKWNETCSDGLEDYSYFIKHICTNHDAISKKMGEDPVLVKSLCQSAMCGCSRDNNANAALCAKLYTTSSDEEVIVDDASANVAIIHKTMMIALGVVSTVILLITLRKVSDVMVEKIKVGPAYIQLFK